MDLVTLEELKEWLGISKDDTSKDTILNIYIKGVSNTIISLIGRDIFQQDYLEKYEGTNSNTLVLKNFPINFIDKIEYVNNGVVYKTLSEDEYDINKKSGILYRDLAWWKTGGSNLMSRNINFPRRHIKIQYNAGYTEVPYDLKFMALEFIGDKYTIANSEGNKESLKSYSISDVKKEWKDSVTLDKEQIKIINKYRGTSI
ncbi:head-tail connector protein [Clostridium rectalis]|uniref:head-tail connector protein n=1 Tax=Clostridium rectalis TaxID=2040295 RepID=UPI000F643D3E|nr:head-tail connector protein [Clostridium rectalis]